MIAEPPTRAAQTAALVRMVTSGKKLRRRRVPRALWPSATEREYARRTRDMIVSAAGPAFAPFIDLLPSFVAAAKASRPFGVDVRSASRAAYDAMMTRIDVDAIIATANRYGKQVSLHTRTQLLRQMKAAIGIDLPLSIGDREVGVAVGRFADSATAHIMSVPERISIDVETRVVRALSATKLDDTRARQALPAMQNVRLIVNRPVGFNATGIAAAVQRNVALGGSTAQLAEDLEERFGFFADHAAFIARDQVGKLNGQASAARSQALGLTRFTWRTSQDERVREEHVALDGEVFDYDDPPDGELPGEPINCRCTAEPLFDDVLDEL